MARDSVAHADPERRAAAQQAAADSNRARNRARRLPHYLVIPAIVVLAVGIGYPVVWQLVTSLREYGLRQQFGQSADFVGIANYTELLSDSQFWAVVARSLLFCFIAATVTLALGLAFALLMNAVGKIARLTLQISLLLAWSMPVVAAMTVWTWLFDRRRGVVNYLLDLLPGVEMNRYNWLENPASFFAVAAIIVIWMSVPFVAFSLFAGLTQVPDEVIEAANLDGASNSQRLRYIIMPMITPVIAIVLMLQVIWDLRVFTQIKMLQDAGSSARDYDLLGTYIFKLGTGSQDFGAASAASVLVLILTISLSWWYVRRMLTEDSP
jgi:N,N'-diacetylchitobiose transport system permease protein